MESGDGIELELNKGTVEKAPENNGFSSHINKENEVIENGADAVHADGGSEGASKVEVINSTGDKDGDTVTATENKASNPSKVFSLFFLRPLFHKSHSDLAAKPSALTAVPSVRRTSVSLKVVKLFSFFMQLTWHNRSNASKTKPLKHALPAKKDDDTHSTAS
ncbi:hypothetical protein B296_00017091 [Ensete ventricosum]|uniref:Uncharacterized protein n=1 Tax=Ensete ventricosum TaxID=4639 RepID=A0A427A652_ENSVE|nr:hypothetical protein B296_00017091 [Ensete ventricosum]